MHLADSVSDMVVRNGDQTLKMMPRSFREISEVFGNVFEDFLGRCFYLSKYPLVLLHRFMDLSPNLILAPLNLFKIFYLIGG